MMDSTKHSYALSPIICAMSFKNSFVLNNSASDSYLETFESVDRKK